MAMMGRRVAFGLLLAGVQGLLLSEEPRVELQKGFLTKAEVAAVLELAEEEMFQDLQDPESGSTASPEVAGGQELAVLNVSDLEAPSKAVLEAILGRFRGSDSGYVVRWEPWRPHSRLNVSGPLHLDARLHPERRRSWIVQLSGAGGPKDGGTVFPCLETEEMAPKEAARRLKLCSRAARHLKQAHEKLLALRDRGLELAPEKQYAFLEEHPELAALPNALADGSRPVNWLWLPSHDGLALAAPGSLRHDGLHDLAERMCRDEALGLKVWARQGDALVMPVLEDGVPDWRLWHAGCSGTQRQRLTLQIFQANSCEGSCSS